MQASAAKKAGKQQAKSAEAALDLEWEQYQQQREDIAPWREAGVRGLREFETMARQGPPQVAPWTAPQGLDPRAFAFQAPTAADMQQDPGYQFRLAEGQKALERSAAARGNLLSGGFARGLTRYGQDVASQEYSNVYQRKMGENTMRYGRALTQNEAAYQRALEQYKMRYNVGQEAWRNTMSPWQTMAGFGQTAATNMAQMGGQYANRAGDLLTGQGAALAAGTMGGANAWSQGLSNISGIVGQGAGLANAYLGSPQRPPPPQYAPTGGSSWGNTPYDPFAY